MNEVGVICEIFSDIYYNIWSVNLNYEIKLLIILKINENEKCVIYVDVVMRIWDKRVGIFIK